MFISDISHRSLIGGGEGNLEEASNERQLSKAGGPAVSEE
jgi:hypothetical protein